MPDSAIMLNEDSLDKDERLPNTDTQDEPRSNERNLLTLPPRRAAKLLVRMWQDQEEVMGKRKAQWKVNSLRRAGVSNVKLIKKQDEGVWQAWAPPGAGAAVSLVNKAATLCRRLTAMMFADPPVPEPVPSSGEEEDREAAILSGRILLDVQGEQHLDDIRQHRRAFDRANTFGSGFVRYWIDPAGGGTTRRAVMASATAETVDEATQLPGPFVKRFVTEDGQLVDDEEMAQLKPLPSLKSEVLTGKHVRFLPHTAEDIWQAEGVMIASFPTWGEIKDRFRGIEKKISEEQQIKLKDFRPEDWEDLIPYKKKVGQDHDEVPLGDEDLIFCITAYFREGGRYENGAYVIALGDQFIAFRSTWFAEIDGKREPLMIPMTQHKQFEEGRERDPYGVGLMQLVGPGNEVRAAQIAALLEHLDKFGNRKVFLPTNSTLQARQLMLPTGAPIPINPGGEPKYEDIPRFPRESMLLFETVSKEMDDDSGLQEAARAVQDPNVKSGRQALTIVSQVQAGLSDIRQNIVSAYLRASRIQLQLIRAFFTLEQQVAFTGDDGQFRVASFRNADLRTTKDVRLKMGSLSMMTPAAKAEVAERYAQFLDPMDVKNMVTGNLGGTIGLEDNPHRSRVKRQISDWSDGPPEGWAPPEPEAQLNPETGQQELAPVPDPLSTSIFTPILADELPDVAVIRAWEMGRAMASTKYMRHPQEWRAAFDQEFFRMRLAAGILTFAEQQQQAAEAQANGAKVQPSGKVPANQQASLTEAEQAAGEPPPVG